MDEAVNMREVHRYIADAIYLSDRLRSAWPNGSPPGGWRPPARRCAVVGAGPTGLTCAFYLALLGHEVTVYDSNAEAGRHAALRPAGIPAAQAGAGQGDRTDPSASACSSSATCAVRHRCRSERSRRAVRRRLPGHRHLEGSLGLPAGHRTEGRDARAPVPGGGLEERSRCTWASSVVVIGGGNAAIDSARTALRLGAKVTIVYRRERKDMPAIPEETEAAEAEGAEIVFLAAPHRIVGDADGRRAGHRSGQNPARRIRRLRPPPAGPDRRDLAVRMRHRHPGGRRNRGRRLRPASGLKIKESGTRRSGPLHARNQPRRSSTPAAISSPARPTSPTPWATARRRRATSTSA